MVYVVIYQFIVNILRKFNFSVGGKWVESAFFSFHDCGAGGFGQAAHDEMEGCLYLLFDEVVV